MGNSNNFLKFLKKGYFTPAITKLTTFLSAQKTLANANTFRTIGGGKCGLCQNLCDHHLSTFNYWGRFTDKFYRKLQMFSFFRNKMKDKNDGLFSSKFFPQANF